MWSGGVLWKEVPRGADFIFERDRPATVKGKNDSRKKRYVGRPDRLCGRLADAEGPQALGCRGSFQWVLRETRGGRLPLARVHLSFSMLHPLYRAASFTWRRGLGAKGEKHRHVQPNMTDLFLKSPYYYLLSNNLNHMRRRIDGDAPADFPILNDLRNEGLTDYLAIVHKFDANSLQGMMGSWSTDRPEGFSEGASRAVEAAGPAGGNDQDVGAEPAGRQCPHNLSRQ